MLLYGTEEILGASEIQELYQLYRRFTFSSMTAEIEAGTYDSHQLGPNEFAEELTRGAIRIAMVEPEDERSMNANFQVGDRVRRCDGLSGLATQNGEVIMNNAALVQMVSDERLSVVGYDAENTKRLTELVKVRWCHPTEGYLICEGWHNPFQLEKIGGETPEYLQKAHDAIVKNDEESKRAAEEHAASRQYKLWRLVSPMEQDLIRRGEMKHPENPKPFPVPYNVEENKRLNTLVEAHIKKHGKLPSNVTRWDDPAPSTASLMPKEKQIVQGGASLVGRRMSSYAKKKIYWLWQDRIPFGSLCTIAGDPDEGKSLITLYVTARVSCGEKLYDNTTDTEPAEVLILSAEDDPETTLRPRLEAAGANLDRIHLLESVVLKDVKGNKAVERIAQLDSDIAMIGAYLDLYPQIKVVIIDPISSFLGSASLNKEQEVRRVLQPLAIRAREQGLAVIMVAHFNKNSEARSAMDRVGGAKAIVGMGRAAWTCVREPEKEGKDGEVMSLRDADRRLFLKLKGNLAPSKIGGLVYTIKTSPVEVEGKDGSPATVDVPYILWLGATDDTAQGVVIGDRNGAPKPKVTDTAKVWLKGHLEAAGGYAPAEMVITAAEAQGYSRSTVNRARQQLGLRVVWVGRASCWALKGVTLPSAFGGASD